MSFILLLYNIFLIDPSSRSQSPTLVEPTWRLEPTQAPFKDFSHPNCCSLFSLDPAKKLGLFGQEVGKWLDIWMKSDVQMQRMMMILYELLSFWSINCGFMCMIMMMCLSIFARVEAWNDIDTTPFSVRNYNLDLRHWVNLMTPAIEISWSSWQT